MKKISKNVFTFFTALVGLVGGSIWAFKTNWEMEPIILIAISSLEVIAFLILRESNTENEIIPVNSTINSQNENSLNKSNFNNVNSNNNTREQNVNVNVNVGKNIIGYAEIISDESTSTKSREAQIDFMKPKIKILFIDDDKNFNVVKILKESGWKNTKTITEVKSLDSPIVKEADILFVDINGVGKYLNLEYQGLDLALMLKQKYHTKKVVIYSANKTSNSFHKAWEECDYKLEKNALPYQFQNLVEEYSLHIHSSAK